MFSCPFTPTFARGSTSWVGNVRIVGDSVGGCFSLESSFRERRARPRESLNEEEFGGGKLSHKAVDGILGDLKKDVSHKRSARLAKSIQESLSTVPALTPSRVCVRLRSWF